MCIGSATLSSISGFTTRRHAFCLRVPRHTALRAILATLPTSHGAARYAAPTPSLKHARLAPQNSRRAGRLCSSLYIMSAPPMKHFSPSRPYRLFSRPSQCSSWAHSPSRSSCLLHGKSQPTQCPIPYTPCSRSFPKPAKKNTRVNTADRAIPAARSQAMASSGFTHLGTLLPMRVASAPGTTTPSSAVQLDCLPPSASPVRKSLSPTGLALLGPRSARRELRQPVPREGCARAEPSTALPAATCARRTSQAQSASSGARHGPPRHYAPRNLHRPCSPFDHGTRSSSTHPPLLFVALLLSYLHAPSSFSATRLTDRPSPRASGTWPRWSSTLTRMSGDVPVQYCRSLLATLSPLIFHRVYFCRFHSVPFDLR